MSEALNGIVVVLKGIVMVLKVIGVALIIATALSIAEMI